MATTSEKLLDAALDVILEKGWAQASTRAVADRAGVRPGVVHYHVASQQDLRIDAAMRGLEPLRVALTEAIARRDPDGAAQALAEDIRSAAAFILSRDALRD